MRNLLDEPLTMRRPAIEACDRGRDAGFIDEDKPFRVEPRLLLLQGLTPERVNDIGTPDVISLVSKRV